MKKEEMEIKINNQKYILNIIEEKRKTIRISITRKGINLRLPEKMPKSEKQKYIEKSIKWASKKLEQNKPLEIDFPENAKIETLFSYYNLRTEKEDRKNYHGSFNSLTNTILIKAPKNKDKNENNANIETLIYKLISIIERDNTENKVNEINKKHFQNKIKIKEIKLKPLSSKWGSLSKNNKLVLNTKLLFCPPDILNYVIIHELSHAIEFNHSKKFWNIVKSKMRNYKDKQKWLKENGNKIRVKITHQK